MYSYSSLMDTVAKDHKTPIYSISPLEYINQTISEIENRGWSKGSFFRDGKKDKQEVVEGPVCIVGGFLAGSANISFNHRFMNYGTALLAIHQALPEQFKDKERIEVINVEDVKTQKSGIFSMSTLSIIEDKISDFNDDEETTLELVIKLLETAKANVSILIETWDLTKK